MRNMKLYIIAMLCLMCIVMAIIPAVSAGKVEETDVVIYEDYYEDEWLFALSKDDEIDISVTVKSPPGAMVDVYVMDYNNRYMDYPDSPFSALESHEGVSSVDFKFKAPSSDTYYLVIDNTDNSRSSDAVPTGDVTVDYEYEELISEKIEGAFWTAWWFCVAGIVIIVVIIVVIILVVVLGSKKEAPPQYPQQYPQQPYGQPPYGQPPYPQQPPYQPPSQPPAQPPGQPPSQPPAEPPSQTPEQSPSEPTDQ